MYIYKYYSKEVWKSNFRQYAEMEKAEVGRVREEKSRSERIRDGESQRGEDAGARKR